MLYFAYGSNMSRAQMRQRCPAHELIGTAVLKDHALCFPRSSPVRLCGVAGLVEHPGGEVWGVIYRLSDSDLAALDKREGYDPFQPFHVNRYNRQAVTVLMNCEPLHCLTYFARSEPGKHVPSTDYMTAIVTGAMENGLPAQYVASLRAIATL